MLDEIITAEANEVTLADLIWKIVSVKVDEAIEAKVSKIKENLPDEWDVYDHSYEIGEAALEHIQSYGGFTEMVTEVIDEYDFSDKELSVQSGTTFTVTVD
jgi:VIT1/CCC1 family predicted Fe2+/Mn2+ transporter